MGVEVDIIDNICYITFGATCCHSGVVGAVVLLTWAQVKFVQKLQFLRHVSVVHPACSARNTFYSPLSVSPSSLVSFVTLSCSLVAQEFKKVEEFVYFCY